MIGTYQYFITFLGLDTLPIILLFIYKLFYFPLFSYWSYSAGLVFLFLSNPLFMILDDAKRFVTRKIKKVEYLNTTLPHDYDAVNTEYRRIRNELDVLSSVVESLGNYEFGGSMMKNMGKLGNKLSSSTRLKVFESNDIYTQASLLGEELSNTTHNSSIKSLGAKFSEAYQKISAAKKDMNSKLKEILSSIKVLREEAKAIDSLRKQADDLRYDLEEKIQEGNSSKIQIDSATSDFNTKALEALRGMKTFVGEAGILGLLNKIMVTHREFSEESSKALSNVQ